MSAKRTTAGPPKWRDEELENLWSELLAFSRDWGLTNLHWHELLPAWYVFSQLTDEDVHAARRAITTPPDGGVDAIHVGRKSVTLLQSKIRASLSTIEDSEQIHKLTRWAGYLVADNDEFDAALRKQRVHASTAALLREGREAVLANKPLELHFLSTGHLPTSRIEWEESQTSAKETPGGPSVFRFLGARQILNLYDDYLVGVRAIPELTLPTKARTETALDGGSTVEMNLFLVPGDAIGGAVEDHGRRLFARNVRDYLGENRVNEKIEETLQTMPDRFRFLNNGITIVCDDSTVITKSGRSNLRLVNPQVVNGQQTSYSLMNAGAQSEKAEVLVKVVNIDREEHSTEEYRQIVHELVFATNWQTRISMGDLRSSDPEQIELGRKLKQLGHYYSRRTTTAGLLRSAAQGSPYITRNQLADAVAGCLWETLPYRVQKDALYEDDIYYEIFDPAQAQRDLVCHYLWKAVQRAAKGTAVKRERGKWLLLYHLYTTIGPELLAHAPAFIADGTTPQGIQSIRTPLQAAAKAGLTATEKFYDQKRPSVDEEPSNFFRRTDLHPPHAVKIPSRKKDTPSFSDFLRSADAASSRRRLQQKAKALGAALQKYSG